MIAVQKKAKTVLLPKRLAVWQASGPNNIRACKDISLHCWKGFFAKYQTDVKLSSKGFGVTPDNPSPTTKVNLSSQLKPADLWFRQHSSMERYVLGWNITFRILNRLSVEPISGQGKGLLVIFFVILFFVPPVIATAASDQWDVAPIPSWGVIAVLFAWFSANYNIFHAASKDNCAVGLTVDDEFAMRRQIEWDRTWFSLRVAMTAGILTACIVLASLFYLQYQNMKIFIPIGTYIVIGLLAYQIGENTTNNILVCVEIRRFALMKHKLHRFHPLLTPEIQKTIRGYNRLGFLSSVLMTFYIGGSALLLPKQAYLRNVVWIVLILIAYFVIILGIIISRLSIQQIVRQAKQQILLPIRKQMDGLFDRLDNLSEGEYKELMRLDNIHTKIQNAPDSCLPVDTLGRLFGNLILPTITFVLAVAGEAYLSALLERFFR